MSVSGNAVDTGRYLITASNTYSGPGSHDPSKDGEITVRDLQTGSSVRVYGDPHVYTSNGDRAEFQRNGLQLNLADGTRVQFNPTAIKASGVAHIGSVAITKGDQAVTQSFTYGADGAAHASIGPVQFRGADAISQDPNRTVMTTARDGGLSTLVNAQGTALSNTQSQTVLDGMGGAGPGPSVTPPPAGSTIRYAPPSYPSPASAPTQGAPAAGGAVGSALSVSAGSGPNQVQITNTQSHVIIVGMFLNGQSATAPSAKVTLQPGQTGALFYQNGQAGFMAQADSSGTFQPTASRLEFEADADGKMKYPDVSYIDGRNASISLSDGAGLSRGGSKSIAAAAPADIVTTDAAGNKTIAGWYDGSTAQMQQGGAFLQSELGTGGAYLHPHDDTLPQGENPMSGTQATILHASFGDA